MCRWDGHLNAVAPDNTKAVRACYGRIESCNMHRRIGNGYLGDTRRRVLRWQLGVTAALMPSADLDVLLGQGWKAHHRPACGLTGPWRRRTW
jgi:hypothetical protein